MSTQVDARGGLRGRASECSTLDELLQATRAGESRACVVRGEAGIGKSALLNYVAASADGARVLHAEGAEAEMELPFAALQQLCAPLLDGLERLATPQRNALETAFGLSEGRRPDRFLVALAVLTLLSDASETQPVVCLIDDAQWLDHSSAEALSFVARRLEAEGVLMLFAERDSEPVRELAGLPSLPLQRLSYNDARALLASTNLRVLDERVRDRLIAETRGNPLALLELPRALSPATLAGGFAVSEESPLERRIEASFRSRVNELDAKTQRLLLVAAAEPLGDPSLLWDAAAALELAPELAAPAEAADLLSLGTRVTFRHPLLRSAIYHAAPPDERRAVHAALADATDPELDPDRRAWHRAHATVTPDESVAAELERSAERARARGGLAAAAAFLERAAELTPDPRLRAERTLGAVLRKSLAGFHEPAATLLEEAERGPLTDLDRALALRLRGRIAWDLSRGDEARSSLLAAAQRLEPLDANLARETHLEALFHAGNAGRLGDDQLAAAKAARAAPRAPGTPDTTDLLLDGLAVLFTEGHATAAPLLKEAVAMARGTDGNSERALRSLRIASRVAAELLDEAAWDDLATRHAQEAREDGVLSVLPAALNYVAALRIYQGDLAAAAVVLDEFASINQSNAGNLPHVMRLLLLAYRGDEAETSQIIGDVEEAAAGGEGLILSVCDLAAATLHNSLGNYEAAFDAADRAAATDELSLTPFVLTELIEAAARSARADVALAALERLAVRTQAAGTQLARGLEAQSRALVTEAGDAEDAYHEAIGALRQTSMRMFLARAQLLYGEWLRRANRRTDAREQLTAAHEFFLQVGANGFAARVARELLATGATPRRRVDEARDQLTGQELQIATLARDGYTNPEIGARLFLSPRTVEWHLRKVFMKLELTSRRQLRLALPADGPPLASA